MTTTPPCQFEKLTNGALSLAVTQSTVLRASALQQKDLVPNRVISEWISLGGGPGCTGKAGAAMPLETHEVRRTTRGIAALASRALAVDRAESDSRPSGDAHGCSPSQDATESSEVLARLRR
jgi:hypothetical protein